MPGKPRKALVFSDIWRTCNKIRAAVFRSGVNLWNHYLPLDPKRSHLLSESKFVTVLNGPLKNVLALSEQEISELADYFRSADGRIFYTQMCEVIHNSVPDFSKNPPLVTGLEWEDPFHVNVLSVQEERRLHLLLSKIAALVHLRKLVLRPYFQDYELISKNTGTVTVDHFSRVLSYLGIMISPDDFLLILKKFMKDSYTINYVAFDAYLDQIIKNMDERTYMELAENVLAKWPVRAISAELPKLPRPEIGKVRVESVFGLQSVFHPCLNFPVEREGLERVIRRIQLYVYSNRIRTADFFKDFDPMNSGRVTIMHFRRGLDMMGLAGINRLWLSEPELYQLIILYRDPNDPDRVCYTTFQDDIDQVFTTKELEKTPDFRVLSPLPETLEIPRKGGEKWEELKTETRDLCEEVVLKIKQKTICRRMRLRPVFTDYDKHNNGHVSRSQFRQCLVANGFQLSDVELFALEERYNDEMGFNYFWFLSEVEPKKFEEPLFNAYVKNIEKLNTEPPPQVPQNKELNIVEILAKIKGKVVRERIRVIEFMRDFDRYNQNIISRQDFFRGLDVCRFNLTIPEMETLMEIFASPLRREFVDYRRFSEVVEEAMGQQCLERAPLITPLQHLPSIDCDRNFLNFEERRIVSLALQKLAEKQNMNLISLFQDYDRTNCGTVSKLQFLKALAVRGLSYMLSSKELEVVEKCFSYERGMRDEVDYRAFCICLENLYAISYRRAV